MATIVFTGFPGFLGVQLLPRVLAGAPDDRALCVVQAKFRGQAEARRDELVADQPHLAGRIDLVDGDITAPGLGVADHGALTSDTTQIWHLAAVYDLHVGRDVGLRVNLDGTRNVLDAAASCPDLQRLHYVSTCYVAGNHAGPFGEDDLDVGQGFNNFYEETKFLAEVDVRKAMERGLSATVYRPAIVVGDSVTGATQKYDGPYFIIQLVLRQRRVAFVPITGDPDAVEFNVVPRDAVIDAIAALAPLKASAGATYQLADPTPPTVRQLIDSIARAIPDRRIVRVRVPGRLAKGAIRHVPGVGRLLRIPAESVDYLTFQARFTSTRTQAALAETGVRIPSFPEYADRIVSWMRAHPEVAATAMV